MRRAFRICAALAVVWGGSVVVAACGRECVPLDPISFGLCMSGPHGEPGSVGPGGSFDSCGNGAVDVGEECDGDLCCNADCTKKAECPGGVIDTLLCGNGKVDAGEECDLGMGNSCADGTVAACTCTCKNKECGDGITQASECCDDGNGGGSVAMSKCNSTCTGCKDPADPACPCKPDDPPSEKDCSKAKIFKAVVSNALNPAQPGNGIEVAWSYKGYLGMQAAKALCQDVGADHVCRYDEIVAADAKGELAGIPTNLTYWLHRTTNVPDYLQDNGKKTCNTAADCGGADVCDPITKVCSWKPGAGGRCNDWTGPNDLIAAGEWFQRLPDDTGGGVAKGTLGFHFTKDAVYDAVTPPICQDDKEVGCAGSCAKAQRAILCCFPKCVP
jgi:hypothetical protein